MFTADEIPKTVEFAKQMTDNKDILNMIENKRIQQVNKEHKATQERFKDLSEKVAKRYQSLAS